MTLHSLTELLTLKIIFSEGPQVAPLSCPDELVGEIPKLAI
jgi:hypothetical protein